MSAQKGLAARLVYPYNLYCGCNRNSARNRIFLQPRYDYPAVEAREVVSTFFRLAPNRCRFAFSGSLPGIGWIGVDIMANARKLCLRCRASKGQFSDEFAVRGKDYRGEQFSFFAAARFLQPQGDVESGEVDALLEVVEMDRQRGLVLIRLPGQTFGNGRTVTVSEGDLTRATECETA